MSSIASQQEILGLENQYWQAMADEDVEAAVALTRFPCVLTSPKGAQRITEEQYRKMMASHKGAAYKNVELKNPQIDSLTDDTALISYSVEVNGMKMLDVSTWVREGGQWRCAFHSENPLLNEKSK